MSIEKSPAWSIAGKHSPEKAQKQPGPGAYTASNAVFKRVPSYTLSKSSRYSSSNKIHPGPADYNPSNQYKTYSTYMGTSIRLPIKVSNKNPGPADYTPRVSTAQTPNYSMRGRPNTNRIDTSPDPQSYEVRFVEKRSSSTVFGRCRRDTDPSKKEPIPGPGNYESQTAEETKGHKFGSSSRLKVMKSAAPGPGSYEVPELKDSRCFSMSARKGELWKVEKIPGPGDYNTEQKPPTRYAYSVGRSARITENKDHSPGPGAYNASDNYKAVGSGKFAVSKRVTANYYKDTPAPGQYNSDTSAKSPAYTLGKRYLRNKLTSVPGPGQYDNSIPQKKLGSSFTKSERFDKQLKNNLAYKTGPGDYEPRHGFNSTNYSFNRSKNVSKNVSGPGPGSYNIKSIIGI